MELGVITDRVDPNQPISETLRLLNLYTGPDAVSHEVANYDNITVEETIETIGFGKFQMGILTYTGLAWLADASEMILLSFIGPAAKCEWGLPSFQEGAISSSVFVGIFVGAYIWGLVSDIKGRRVGFLATAVFTFFFGLLSAWSPTYWFLLLARTLVGFGLGGSSVIFSLCMEFLPASSRGFWLVFLNVLWTVGSVSSALLAWVILPNHSWRILVAVSALPFLLLLVFYSWVPESPRYLMVKGDIEGAREVLRQVAYINGRSLPTGNLSLAKSCHQINNDKVASKVNTPSDSLDEVRGDTNHGGVKGAWSIIQQLFSPELKLTTILLWTFFFANAFTYYGLVLLTTQLPVESHDEVVSMDAGCMTDGRPGTDVASYKAVLITSLAELPGLVLACLTVERYGRKASMGALLLGTGLFVAPLWKPLSEMATTTLMFGARSCIMGAFSILWAYAPELYPTKLRSTGLGFSNSAGRIGGFLCPFVAIEMMKNGHRILSVTLFSTVPLIASIATLLFPVETKGLRLPDDIQSHKPGASSEDHLRI
ncbi:organic cation/carnitine transporter 7 [Physcomitrium patens]|uniref:Major facilitator superfamily (MFS) profile domain-containing protein n=1 Tax=Physcomitrium patens TaxID=3218 RepID=A0A2K1LA88_PHYPA|nr:organic cation/carnitine transporter 7-like isoform X1 [Physcomitrium patens]XP_024402947.1 organic cation/carnitine transporter 7-like isoform X1 [Physcomitrium patens]XP_024403029.1 organic cation/carnitine transporter 7-like isoform X1 [Physcomitrium patens]XP_024403109.1 organic cation/carnitine transporter 7-like isoform X1 [Physcomitrium patens]XP_024403195.1 organic cation/carnitine transporter 7-like isoform X1 [Physcomitrium patens]PNR62939.1 hypothetical protein PHYPA_001364 [Phys|eukprot:XP_024402858.1 organic cation/carnitine transporter 7-like isoform X1 [Physcomitrella patens]